MRTLTLTTTAAAFVAGMLLAPAYAQTRTEPELIPGAYLMTSPERDTYRQRMQAAPTAEAKARVRSEHIRAMDARARNVGLALNLEPVAKREVAAGKAATLRNVCFSCHGSERYERAKQQVENFLAASLATAGGVEDITPVQLGAGSPSALPPGAPKMSRSQVQNLTGLKRAIVRLNDYFSPKLTNAEVDELVANLNAAYYKF
jgi:hypothetical protein